jgi:hypothetical protein
MTREYRRGSSYPLTTGRDLLGLAMEAHHSSAISNLSGAFFVGEKEGLAPGNYRFYFGLG